MMESYWQNSPDELARLFTTDLNRGLSSDEARSRYAKHGANQLAEKKGEGPLALFLGQFKNFIIWVLVVAALISGFLKEWVDTIAILAIVALNAILGFIQEYRAEKSLAALRKLSSPNSKIVRNGRQALVPSSELVPGDIVELEAGDHIPADCRIVFTTANFSVQEASLTGESTPVAKTVEALPAADVPLADRSNMVFMGTAVVSGRSRGLVAVTGMNTELGRIADMLQDIESEPTPLQKKLNEFGKLIVRICFILVALVFLMQWIRGGHPMEMFLTAVSLAVAAIPEGLPAVVTIALALGVQRMVKRHALIRKLPSVETLGCATVICSDKTGTLTKNEMTVQAIYAGALLYRVTGIGYAPKGDFSLDGKTISRQENPDLIKGLTCGTLCNGAQLLEEKGLYRIAGDPTEGAILTCAAKAGLLKTDLEKEYPYVEEIPFDSDRKMMSVIRRSPTGRLTAFVKGAPDLLLAKCVSIQENGHIRPLAPQDHRRILDTNAKLANEAMRVLGVAYRDFDGKVDDVSPGKVETGLTFVALIAMIDPPREEAKEAIGKCRTAGIKAVMITGDHKNTAVAVARQLGLYNEGSKALSGSELDALSENELDAQIEHIPVYARVSPENKLRIVTALRKKGHVVAMTGDGVNDAPAVKEADIGVAMGITGTDVTKEVSDMVVTDDNFASIVSAVEEGRGIYDNIQKVIHYLLSCNAGEILVMFLSSLFGMPVPLLPIQILWVNLVTDGLPALALGVDPIDKNIMTRTPLRKDEDVISSRRLILMVAQGFVISLCCLAAFSFIYYLENRWSLMQLLSALGSFDMERIRQILTVPDSIREEVIGRARTVAFIVLAFCQDFHSYNCRNQVQSLFRIGLFSNRKLVGATLVSMTFNGLAIYCPFFQKVLKTQALTWPELFLVIAIASTPLWVMEVVKAVRSPHRHGT
jgi:Ca2+-transporting ATPase